MKKNKTEIRELDMAEILDTEGKMVAYLNAELAEGDPYYIKIALNNIARARNMTALSKKAGVPRASLYRALSDSGNPEYSTIQKIVDAMDLQLIVVPKGARVAISG